MGASVTSIVFASATKFLAQPLDSCKVTRSLESRVTPSPRLNEVRLKILHILTKTSV